MARPEKQKASGVACMINGILAKRVQTLGSSVDISREATNELANAGTVEWIGDSPSVTIQIDTNDVGSTDTLALLTDKMIAYSAKGDTLDSRGGTFRYYIKSATSNSVSRTITEQDLTNGYCSILATLNEDGTSAERTLWMNHCAITAMNLSYDVNGNATENYTLKANNKTWFLNALGGSRCYVPRFEQIAYTSSGIGITGLASCIPSMSSVYAIGIDNNILRARGYANYGVTGNTTIKSGRGDISATCTANVAGGLGQVWATSYALSTPWVSTVAGSTNRVWIIYKPAGETWAASSLATNPGWELHASAGALGGLRKANIKAYLYNTNSPSKSTYTLAGKALRLQTVSIDVSPGEDELYELGTDGFYGISKQSPVPITVNVSANDSDLTYFAMLLSTSASNTAVKSVTAADFNGYNALRVEIYKDKSQTTLLKTITCTKMYVNNENFNVSVGGNATNEISFTTDNITIVGSGVNVTGGAWADPAK